MSSPTTQTPWGRSQHVETIATGIDLHSTPSHGGFRLSATRLAEMPPALRKRDCRYCAEPWYEEDCEAALVVMSFPDIFPVLELAAATKIVRYFYPGQLAEYYAGGEA